MPDRHRILWLLVAAALIGAVWWVLHARSGPSFTRFEDWLIALERAETGAFEEATRWAAREWPRLVEHLPRLAEHDEPRVRALCCKLLADRPTPELETLLLARASDRDWSVRSAAYRALEQLGDAVKPTPMRDTLLAERERVVLAWVQRNTDHNPRDLCEVYAAEKHLQFGQTLADRCAACHARRAVSKVASGNDCDTCHAPLVRQWVGSSHARSLSHLNLVTVDPDTKQPRAWSWGERKGIACGVCHEAKAERAAPTSGACRYEFEPPVVTCATCHPAAEAQWQRWLAGPQPRRLDWPPGAIDLEHRGDRRTCIDCHMPDSPTGRAHDLTARRNPALLAGGVGVDLAAEADHDGRWLVITLTNLAGHNYPTGTRRRALRVYAGFDGAPADLIAELAPDRLPGIDRVEGRAKALAPGERRAWRLPIHAGAGEAVVRLTYVRNRLLAAGVEQMVTERRLPLVPWGRDKPSVGGAG